MRVATFRRKAGPHARFEGIRELVTPAGLGTSTQTVREDTSFACRPGGPLQSLAECTRCEHFVNWRPGPHRGEVQIRCLFTDADPVRDLMTLPPFLFVDPALPCVEAERLARRNALGHLLVARDAEVFGVIERGDHVPPIESHVPVAVRMTTFPWAVAPDATLGEVAGIFREEGPGIILVVEGGRLIGLVTRGDLLRAGCPAECLDGTSRAA